MQKLLYCYWEEEEEEEIDRPLEKKTFVLASFRRGQIHSSADPDIFLGGGGGFPTENARVLLYDTLISGFQWM